MTTDSKNTETDVSLSLTVAIEGTPIPLTSGTLDLSELKSDAKTAISNAVKGGLAFSTPADFSLDLPLQDLSTWLNKKGFSIPSGLTSLLDQTIITIHHASFSTKGDFGFSFAVDFPDGLTLPAIPTDMFELDEIGLAVEHKVKNQVTTEKTTVT